MLYQTVSLIQQYDSSVDKWQVLQVSLPLRIANFGACYAQNAIFVAGGVMSTQHEEPPFTFVDQLYKLNLDTNKWSKLARMRKRRNLY